MPSSRANHVECSRWIHLALVASLAMLLSGWTCSLLFVSCQGTVTQPQINALSPVELASTTDSAVLTVVGSGFTSESQILWNSHALPTIVLDSQHLQATITQETFSEFGGSAGTDVQISSALPEHNDHAGCPVMGSSNVLLLVIN